MKTKSITIALVLMLFSISGIAQQKDFYDVKVKTLVGGDFDFSSLKGKKVMVVNTASKCGFATQFKALQALYDKYGSEDFVIVGFPSSDFANQELGTSEEILQFCRDNYSVTFPMMEKVSVKGDDAHPLYKWLTSKAENGVMDAEVKWNFQKYLIDENGKLVDVLLSKEEPDSEKVVSWLTSK